jgi:hypothetical protein
MGEGDATQRLRAHLEGVCADARDYDARLQAAADASKRLRLLILAAAGAQPGAGCSKDDGQGQLGLDCQDQNESITAALEVVASHMHALESRAAALGQLQADLGQQAAGAERLGRRCAELGVLGSVPLAAAALGVREVAAWVQQEADAAREAMRGATSQVIAVVRGG